MMFDDVHDARELITQAIGAGSMCWVGGTGALEFDSNAATKVADAAYQRLQAILSGILSAPLVEAGAIAFSESCCGKCVGGTCYVDQMTGA